MHSAVWSSAGDQFGENQRVVDAFKHRAFFAQLSSHPNGILEVFNKKSWYNVGGASSLT